MKQDVDPQRLLGSALEGAAIWDKDPVVILVCSSVMSEPLCEGSQEILHQDTPECRAVADDDMIRLHNDGLLLLEEKRVSDRAVVIENGAGKDICVCRLHNLRAEARAHSTPVGADEVGMVLRNEACFITGQ